MPPQSRPPVAAVTPRKTNEITSIVARLNYDFNMGIEMPDETMSPAQRKARADRDAQYARWAKICTSLHFLFHHRKQDGEDLLEKALTDFETEARADLWVTRAG